MNVDLDLMINATLVTFREKKINIKTLDLLYGQISYS